MTETELERIYESYQELVVDVDNEIVSKRKVRNATYLSRDEKDAVCKGKVKHYINMMLKEQGQLDVNVDDEEYDEIQEFEKVVLNSEENQIMRSYIPKHKEIK